SAGNWPGDDPHLGLRRLGAGRRRLRRRRAGGGGDAPVGDGGRRGPRPHPAANDAAGLPGRVAVAGLALLRPVVTMTGRPASGQWFALPVRARRVVRLPASEREMCIWLVPSRRPMADWLIPCPNRICSTS